MSEQVEQYRIRRCWYLPFVIEVWDTRWLPLHHWRKGQGWLWRRVGLFFRRKTARAFVQAKLKDPWVTA